MMKRLLLFRMRRHMVASGLKCPNIGSWSFWLEPADMLAMFGMLCRKGAMS